MTSGKAQEKHGKLYVAVRSHALGFPEAYEEFPWGHSAIKVRKRIFVTLGEADGTFSMSLKLGASNFDALLLPFTEPTHYGMGKHGWVTARFPSGGGAPMALLRGWIEESYRAIAPKALVKELDGLPAKPRAAGARKKKSSGRR